MVKIQLETGYLDVKEGTSFPLNFQVGDIRDLSERKGTFSKSITLIGSKNNHLLLNNYYDVNITAGTFDINKLTKCTVLQNNIPIVTDALLQLVNVRKVQLTDAYEQGVEYEVLVKDAQAEFYTAITNKELTDLDFSDCNHNFDITAITDSWNHTQSDHYKYIMGWNENTDYTVNHFKPAIYAKSYWDRIFAYSGFTYQWDELQTAHFDKLLIPYNGDVNNFDYSDYRVTADTTFLYTGVGALISATQQITTWTETLDNQNLFDPTTGIYDPPFNSDTTQGQTYNFNFTYDYNLFLDNVDVAPVEFLGKEKYSLIFEITVNGSGVGIVEASDSITIENTIPPPLYYPVGATTILSASGTTNYPIPININPGDVIEIYAGVKCENVWQVLGVLFPSGFNGNVNINANISSLNVDITPSNNIQVIGGTQVVNEFIPLKVKQSDFIKAIFQMYNLYAYPDINQPNKLILVHRDEWYDSGVQKNWTRKLAKNQEQELIFLPDLSNKKLKLTYKPDTDSANNVYTQATAETYGQIEYTFDNEYVKDTDTKELLFSPTPVNKTSFDAYLPLINGTAPNTNIRILYDGGLQTCLPFNIYEQGTIGTTGLTDYPQTGHFDNALTPTFDINYGLCDYYFYQTSVLTNNNLYNLYWRRTVNQINVGKMLIAYFYLREDDIQTLKLNDKIRIDNSWWNINRVIDYNANDETLTKVELISIDSDIKTAPVKIKRPIFIGDVNTPKGDEDILKINRVQSNVNLSAGSFEVYGKGNVVSSGLSGIVIGDNQTVSESGITTTNLRVTETINGEPIGVVLPAYKKYVATISQTGTLAPTVTILENTIGDIVWTRSSTGLYFGTLLSAFTIGKTYQIIGTINFLTEPVVIFSSSGVNNVYIQTQINTLLSDGLLDNTTIEIRIYP
jgi:hypothetical protein